MRRMFLVLVAIVALLHPTAVDAGTDRATVFVDGDMPFFGSTGAAPLNKPIVDLAVTPTGKGYWLLAGDGGIFSYGDAAFYGSTGNLVLRRPVVSFAPTPSGRGYWLAASDGGVFTFGDATFLGSAGNLDLVQPVVGIVPTRTGKGYYLVASDGGVFTYGDAKFLGSLAGTLGTSRVVALAAHGTETGYGVLASDHEVYTFGPGATVEDACFGEPVDLQFRPNAGYEVLCDAGNPSPTIEVRPGGGAVALGFSPTGNGRVVATSGRALAEPASPTPGGEYVFARMSGSRPVRWDPCTPISWRFDPRGAPAGAEAFIVEGVEYVAQLTGLPFRYAGTTSAEVHAAPSFVVRFGALEGQVVGYTTYRASGARWSTATLTLTNRYQDPAALKWGVRGPGTVFLHEMGHVLGLGHPNDRAQLMNVSTGAAHRYESGDLAGIWHLSAAQGCVR